MMHSVKRSPNVPLGKQILMSTISTDIYSTCFLYAHRLKVYSNDVLCLFHIYFSLFLVIFNNLYAKFSV